jgi:hypothetical protein
MPKNKLFKRQNYSLKNYFFSPFMHFIFQNAFKFHFEIFPFNLFSAQSTNTQNKPERSLQLQP